MALDREKALLSGYDNPGLAAVKNLLFLSLLVFFSLPGRLESAEIEGYDLPDSITRFDTPYRLSGCGLRELLFSDIYLLGMYLPADAPRDATMREAGTGKIFLLRVLYKGDLPDDLPDLWREPLADQLSKEYLSILQDVYDRVAPGDTVEFALHPGTGEVLRINGAVEIRESDVELIPALVELWLGDDPVSGNLKRLLMKGQCD